MNKKAKKYIVVLITVMMSAALISMTAFAQAQITPERDDSPVSSFNSAPSQQTDPLSSSQASAPSSSSGSPSDSSQTPSSASSPSGEEGTSSDGTGNVDAPSEAETVPVKLNDNDGSAIRVVNVELGTQVKDLGTPTRSGYVFSYWTMNGAKVSSSFEIYSEITLTAQWEEKTASSRKPSSYASVDTHKNEVDQAASRAEAAISDPDVLSSEDWNALLSTGSEASSGEENSSGASSSQASGNGGGSWLFPVGILLIVLSAFGIGAFVYLQFFSGPGGPPSGPGGGDFDDSMEFTDISSNSSGPYGTPEPDEEPSPRANDDDDTMPIPRQARRLSSKGYGSPKAQAKPVTNSKKNFDWDKFLNDDI